MVEPPEPVNRNVPPQWGGTSAPPSVPPYPGAYVHRDFSTMNPFYEPPRRMNILAVLSLCLSPILGGVSVVLGIIAQVQIKRTGERGRGLAIAGIVVGAIPAVIVSIIVLGAIIAEILDSRPSFPDPAPSISSSPSNYGDDDDLDVLWDDCADGDYGSCEDLYYESDVGTQYEDFGWTCGDRTTGGMCADADADADADTDTSTTVVFNDVRPGDCFIDGSSVLVTVSDCALPHLFEAYHSFEMTDGPLPSEEAMDAQEDTECDSAFDEYVGISHDETRLQRSTFQPTEESWSAGDRTIICVIESDTPVTGAARNSAR